MSDFVSSTCTRQNGQGSGRWGRREKPDRKYAPALKQRALELESQDHSVLDISTTLNVPYRTVWQWLNG